jgi:hypothetical protein
MPPVSIPITQLTDAGAHAARSDERRPRQRQPARLQRRPRRPRSVSTDAGAQSITIVTPGHRRRLRHRGPTLAVPAGATRIIGPFAPSTYNQSDGSVRINPSIATTLKFRAYRV